MNDIERLVRDFSGVKDSVSIIISEKDCEVIKQALQEKAERENNGWIKCSDRLPEMTKDYGMISNKVLLTNGSEIVFGWLRNNKWVTPDMIPFERQELITAWKPLPEPYKEAHRDNEV